MGSTGSPLGKAGERCEGGGVGEWRLAHWKIQISSGGIRSAVDGILTCVSSCSEMAYSEKERVSVMLGSCPHVHKCTMLVVGRHDIKIKKFAAITMLIALHLSGILDPG